MSFIRNLGKSLSTFRFYSVFTVFTFKFKAGLNLKVRVLIVKIKKD